MSISLIKLINLLISFVSVMVSGFCFAITLCYDRHDKAGFQNGRDHQKPRRTHNE